MDSRSEPSLKNEVEIFNVPSTQLAIDNSDFIEVHPVTSLSEKSPIEFFISGSGEQYLDLAHTLLHLQLKITKKDGSALTNDNKHYI